jgi:hypothetical protein
MGGEILTEADDLALDMPEKPQFVPGQDELFRKIFGDEGFAEYRREQEARWGEMGAVNS